ncbi:ssr6083 (plasmid) [Synechocystis sp. PCC 6803]|uniref:Ssr6024 protein n=1 Tax=Synechocystis sp. (strain ATCC 27184 / PCC 6803 / Kazusa) TaxID=1111708 RepID=Q6YRS1_SYNY3|nr:MULTISPECIES: hypothetical protein [unclassified Synechocystis]AGF53733.1 hypothetical protein MYO_3250 [Synechocystis sp. PCC 6803]AGF53792.1 hypothetical protein MYO_3840 [Synechocystis sp. PCC 6803]AVP91762.1 hypothetical protein C7I86_18520 [Synechocystis sp. IPPAS B-1465]MBD2620021.1 hypothetical protein [Synechocystis sp. FACHB-898]MBD2640702.1 hypothetical protein [Synechocystis sp. FACHB-908]
MTIQEAKEIAAVCSMMRNKLPDGMWEEVRETILDYREGKDGEAFAEELSEICKDWGFSI